MTDKLNPGETGKPGTTQDPNQADLTGIDQKTDRDPEAEKKAKANGGIPGTTTDPNQANRT
ncbi:MAG: hypothetical protein AAFM92_07710 [Pseudomonadota bacterium]